MWMLGIELRTSGRAASALTTEPSLQLLIVFYLVVSSFFFHFSQGEHVERLECLLSLGKALSVLRGMRGAYIRCF